MLKHYRQIILMVFFSLSQSPLHASVTPAQITPPQINPTTVNPTVINPTTITPTTINPTIINPTTINPVVINPTTINPTVINPPIINPPTINPVIINPSIVNPVIINPPIISPQIVTPVTISPSITTPTTITPTTTTPTNTTPTTITPATISPGTSAAESTSISLPNTTASDVVIKPEKLVLPCGMVVRLNGQAEVVIAKQRIHPLKEKSLLYASEMIITKADSMLALRFNDGSFFVLGPNSVLEIQKYHFTLPAKGKTYIGEPKDRALLKLVRGNLKAQLGALALFNKPSAYAILTPRGRLELADANTNANLEMIYNNKIGLVVRALGLLHNSRGEVSLTDKNVGLVSAVIGSFPSTTTTLPMILTDEVVKATALFFSASLASVNTGYSERIIDEEEALMSSELMDTAGDRGLSSDSEAASFGNREEGEDDGNEEDIDADDDDDEE